MVTCRAGPAGLKRFSVGKACRTHEPRQRTQSVRMRSVMSEVGLIQSAHYKHIAGLYTVLIKLTCTLSSLKSIHQGLGFFVSGSS
jgi:hypothetical protein